MKTHFQNLFLALMLLALPAKVGAQLTFTTNSGAITITGYSGGGAVVIPDTTNGWPVTFVLPPQESLKYKMFCWSTET